MRLTSTLITTAVLLAGTAAPAAANHGAPDPTFDGDGKVLTTFFESGGDGANAVAAQLDGRVVVGGHGNGEPAILRYNTNGSLDTSFDGDGKVKVQLTIDGSRTVGSFAGVAIQPDGKILAVGNISKVNHTSGPAIVVRLHPNGQRDTTFSGDGILVIGGLFRADTLALQGDGKILVVGYGILRLLPNGTRDTGFGGGDGLVPLDVGVLDGESLTGVDPLPDGRIALTGWGFDNVPAAQPRLAQRILAMRLHNDGRRDTSFDGDGVVILKTPVTDHAQAYDLVHDRFGRFVLAGIGMTGGGRISVVIRLRTDGQPDASFGSAGFAYANLGDTVASNIALNPDEKIVAAGYFSTSNSGSQFMLLRYHENGVRDSAFDGDGIVATDFASSLHEQAAALTVAPNGFLVTVGSANVDRTSQIAVTRHHGFADKRGPAVRARVLRSGKLLLSGEEPADVTVRLLDRRGRKIRAIRTALHAAGRRVLQLPRGATRRTARVRWTATDAMGNRLAGSARVGGRA